MDALLPLAAYAARLACFLVAAYGIGFLTSPRNISPSISPVIALCLRLVHGFGVLGLLALSLALVGGLSSSALLVATGVAFVLGVFFIVRRLRSRELVLQPFLQLSREKLHFHHWLLLGWSAVFAANVSVGALAPDAAQDSLWYHLSCARAWLHWHTAQAWPTVYPSSYHLHGSMLYSFALALGDEIDCSILYATSGFLTFLIIALFAKKWFGGRAALWSWFLCASAYATHVWFVPINTGSDLIAAMFACSGGLVLVDAMSREESSKRTSQLVLAGWLLGWGVVTKLTVLGYMVLPLVLLFGGQTTWRWGRRLCQTERSKHYEGRAALGDAIAFLVPLSIPFLAWSIRSLAFGAGNPFYPLFRDILPLKPDFAVTRRNLSVNTLYPFSLDGFALMLAGLPQKLEYLVTARSPAFLLHAAVTVVGFLSRDRRWRLVALLGIWQWGMFLWSVGFNETVKYFSLCYPMHFIFIGALLVHYENTTRLSTTLKQLSLTAFAVIIGYIYLTRQIEWGGFETVQWRYRPVLTSMQRVQYLRTKPYNLHNIELYAEANRVLPADAGVLFPDNAYPFYLDRRYLWCDEDLDFFTYLEDLGIRDETDLRLYFSDHQITHVISDPKRIASRPVWRSVLTEVDISTSGATMRLYSVRR